MKIPLGKDPEGTLKQLPALAETKRVVVLASGDPNFYGVGPLVVRVLGAEHVVIHPNLTAVQTACARLRMPWQDATVISLHGRTWEHLAAALGQPGPLLIYTDPAHTPGGDCPVPAGPGPGSGPLLRLGRPGPAHGAGHLDDLDRGPGARVFAPEPGRGDAGAG